MEVVSYSKYNDKLKYYFFLEILSFILFSDNSRDQLLISSGYAGCSLLPNDLKKQLLVSDSFFETTSRESFCSCELLHNCGNTCGIFE